MLGWGPMSSTALGLGRDPPLLGALDGVTSLEKGERATQTQSLPGVTPSPCPPGAPSGGRAWGELWQALQPCGGGVDVRLRRDVHRSSAGSQGDLGRGDVLRSTGSNERHPHCSWEQGTCSGQTRLGPCSPSAASAAAPCPSPPPVPSPALSGGCFSSIPGELQPQSPSLAGTGAEEPLAVEGKHAVKRTQLGCSCLSVELPSRLPAASAAPGGCSRQRR